MPVERGFSDGSCAAGAEAPQAGFAAPAPSNGFVIVAPAALTTTVSMPFNGIPSPGFGARCFPFARARAYASNAAAVPGTRSSACGPGPSWSTNV